MIDALVGPGGVCVIACAGQLLVFADDARQEAVPGRIEGLRSVVLELIGEGLVLDASVPKCGQSVLGVTAVGGHEGP